jgi:hypothetical protein
MALRGRLEKGTLVAWQGNGMVCVNQTRPHNVNQMGKTQSNDLVERHGRGTAWEWHGMCESALTGLQLVKKFPAFYGTRRLITASTGASHLFQSWASLFHFIPPHHTSWISILILCSHLHLFLPSGLFLSGFLTKTLYMPLLSPIHTTCPTHLILLNVITQTI